MIELRRYLPLLVALLGLCLPVPAAAAEPMAGPVAGPLAGPLAEPRFEIETIVVEANRLSPDLVIAESLLKAGKTYGERELRQAMYRIVRLPRILDADFSLRKGSVRGRYILVIRILETRRWFFGLESEAQLWADEVTLDWRDTTDRVYANPVTIGHRIGVGRHGTFFFTIGGFLGTLGVGYTHNNLFDRNVRLSIGYEWSDCDDGRSSANDFRRGGGCYELLDLGLDPTYGSWDPSFRGHTVRASLGIPLSGNQSIRLRAIQRQDVDGSRVPFFDASPDYFYIFDNRKDRRFEATWVHNTLDDPALPTRGTLVEAGVEFSDLSTRLRDIDVTTLDPPIVDTQMSSRQAGLRFVGARHWALTRKHTVSASLNLFAGRSRFEDVPDAERQLISGDADTWDARLGFGHSMLLHASKKNRGRGELRWLNDIELSHTGTSPSFGQPDNPLAGYRASSGLAFRNTWGLFKLGISYVDVDR